MIEHVVIPISEKTHVNIWLSNELRDWLNERFGPPAPDTYEWYSGKCRWRFINSEYDEDPLTRGGDRMNSKMNFSHFYFHNIKDAMLFKLAWGGK